MSAVPEDARGLRRASGGNASVAPRDTEKLARLRRARKEAARDIEAERRTDDARVTELHAQLDAKLRERNERRARLLRLESERIGVEREARFAHAAAERDAAATRLDAGRGDETAKKEARRAAFHARRRAKSATKSAVDSRAAAEERWERLNETVADEAARTPRLRETRRFVSYDAMARAFRDTNESVAANEDVVAAFESAAAVSAASPVPAAAAPSSNAFEFAPPSVQARVTSPSREDAETRAARLRRRRSREDRLRRVANECGVLDDALEAETETLSFRDAVMADDASSDDASVAGTADASSDAADASDVSASESIARTVESPERGRVRVSPGGVAWKRDSGARRGELSSVRRDLESPGSRTSPRVSSRDAAASSTKNPGRAVSPRSSPSSPDFESRLAGVVASVRRSRSDEKKNVAATNDETRFRTNDARSPSSPSRPSPSAGHTFSALGTYATDSPDPTRLMAGEEAEVGSRLAFRRVALELADSDRFPRAASVGGGGPEPETRATFSTRFFPKHEEARKPGSWEVPETRDAARERRRGRGRRRPETRREKMFGKLPFRVAGAALDATRVVGGGALRGVGGLLRGLRGIVRGGDGDDADEPAP